MTDAPICRELLTHADVLYGRGLKAQGDALAQAAGRMDAAFATGNVKAIVGAWARARRLLKEHAGVPLMPPAVVESTTRLAMVLNALRSKP